jgi:4,5-DOPA dioxygenase extradiol
MNDRMPALYIGHGAPPAARRPAVVEPARGLAADLPRPTAILIVSAHWESAPVMLSADGAPLVYDFGGFAARVLPDDLRDPRRHGARQRVAAMMPADEPVHQHPAAARPRRVGAAEDHVPDGDIPVLQMSLPTQTRPAARARRAAAPLRDEGVLIIGSGFLTHGLPFLTEFRIDAAAPGWSSDFDAWAGEALRRGDVDALASYRSQAPGMPYAHPTVEHYTPLFVTLGAATDSEEPGEQLFEGFWMGLSKRSLQVA